LFKTFFCRPTLTVARELLGKYIVRRAGRRILSGKIVETEAYCGEDDLACHASRGRTQRTEILYAEPGTMYVYLIYGMYWCLNIVTERKDFPSAVLIRAVEPIEGLEIMAKRRGLFFERVKRVEKSSLGNSSRQARTINLTNGPGKLSQAFGITGRMHGKRLGRDTITIENRGTRIPRHQVCQSPRVGVEYAKRCKNLPWRFFIKGNAYVSQRA